MAGLDKEPERGRRRRELLRGGVLVAFGAGAGAVGFAEAANVLDRRLPLRGGAADTVPGADRVGGGELRLTWFVQTDRKLVALTFDDGPGPRWTPMVLDILHQRGVPATFFMVGERARRHATLVRGRMARHEVASHTWSHRDLGRVDAEEAYDDLARTHQELTEVTGQAPRLLRPPYGHLGGGALAAAARMNYQVVLWSLRMREGEFLGKPSEHARHIVAHTRPGSILLAHDVGDDKRLVALRGLPQMIDELRTKNYQFVTVSRLLGVDQ